MCKLAANVSVVRRKKVITIHLSPSRASMDTSYSNAGLTGPDLWRVSLHYSWLLYY